VLGDLIERMLPNRTYENCQNELKLIIRKIVDHSSDFEALLAMVT